MITFTYCSKWNHLIYITLFLSLQIHSSKTVALLSLFQKITLTILQKAYVHDCEVQPDVTDLEGVRSRALGLPPLGRPR
jgi:hypothetical protein